MERRHFLKFTTGAALSGALTACGGGGGAALETGAVAPTPGPGPEPVRHKVVVGWNNIAMDAIRATRAAPPVAARALAVVHTAMYDAWAAYDRVALGTRHGAALRRPLAEQTAANQLRAFSFAAYVALIDQFPAEKAAFDAHMARLGYKPADSAADSAARPATPAGIGALAARSCVAFAHTDGSNQLGTLSASGIAFADYSGYTAPNPPLRAFEATPRSAIPRPGQWQPVIHRDAAGNLQTPAYVTPFWGQVRPFALKSGSQFRPAAPAVFGSAEFAAQAKVVVDTQAALSQTQKVIADYWAGGATGELPSSYWSQFAQFVSRRDNHSEEADIKLFFALSNALFDAGIAAWDAKRAYNSARPITAIRYLYAGQTVQSYGPGGPAAGLRAVPGEAWTPFYSPAMAMPSHPDHVSGHSTYSMASAEVLRLFTGSETFNHGVMIHAHSLQADPALPARDVALAWATFSVAAAEAGMSRVYAGIHFPAADLAGRTLGQQVGAAVFAKAQAYWLGHM